ncbi:MAG: omptin family outer membrane protease [Treponema sp.]|nr:omptin family outer membrane protease [Treponema sp.]
MQAETSQALPPAKGSYTLSVATSFGFLWGQSEEIVYKALYKDDYTSQLLWDMKPLLYVGASLDFSLPMKHLAFFVGFSSKFGIPAQTGIMEDRDWQSSSPELTDFSSHDNNTHSAVLLDGSLGLSIPLGSKLLLKVAYAGLSYMYFSWTAQDGFGRYADSNWVEKPYSGPVIDYIQSWLIFSPGISLYAPLVIGKKILSLEASFRIGPVVFCNDQDDHLTTKTRYNDYMSGGLFLEPRLEFAFSPCRWLSISLHGAYRSISGVRGATYRTFSGASSKFTTPDAGVGYAVWDTGLSLTIRF